MLATCYESYVKQLTDARFESDLPFTSLAERAIVKGLLVLEVVGRR
jgi:hypothetical protein